MTLDDIPGLVTDEGIETLRRYATNKRVLEVGVWKGKTTIAMAQVAKSVVALDCFNSEFGNTLPECWDNVRALAEKVHLVVAKWPDALQWLDLRRFDVIHYDADHSYAATSTFIEYTLLLNPDALLIVDDYSPAFPEVMRAVDDATGWRKRLEGVKMLMERDEA